MSLLDHHVSSQTCLVTKVQDMTLKDEEVLQNVSLNFVTESDLSQKKRTVHTEFETFW